eukprot:s1923_g7.t1
MVKRYEEIISSSRIAGVCSFGCLVQELTYILTFHWSPLESQNLLPVGGTNWRLRAFRMDRQHFEYFGLCGQDFVRDTKQRYLTAREAVSHSLAGLADSVASRWRRLTVASFHERLGKCCCSRNEWQPFKLGGPIVDYECKIGFMDYMDAITARSMEGASSNTSEVDNILDQCAASKGWQYQSWDWSPPAANISMPGEIVAVPPVPIVALHHLETSVVVSDVVKPTDDLIVAVPEDASSSSD